jgi:23S rRNA (adenine2503-C2)-methyltransferase
VDEKLDLLDLGTDELGSLLSSWGEPKFRVAQIQQWLYRELVDSFEVMTNLPRGLRERLANETRIGGLVPVSRVESRDRLTDKTLFKLDDGETVETVLMLYADAPDSPELAEGEDRAGKFKRRTLCISTQVGCPIGCPFCATGQAGYIRNLTGGEIVAQVLHFAREAKKLVPEGHIPITNIVIMGMGEPLMKFEITLRALHALIDPARFGLGARRITVSTSGLIPGIQQLSETDLQVNLAVSLHAADDDLRNRLVPINRKYPLRELMSACRDYVQKTHRRVTFEYALMEGVNDRAEQAQALAKLLRGLLCHVNLIPLNPTADSDYHRPAYGRVKEFERLLDEAGIPTTMRVEKGIEIAAGCGQLRQESIKADKIKSSEAMSAPAMRERRN